jgi:hypothetical protein
MPHYRVYILDRRGDLISAVEFDCSDDEAAKVRVRELLDGHDAELWRLVTLFEPEPEQGPDGLCQANRQHIKPNRGYENLLSGESWHSLP